MTTATKLVSFPFCWLKLLEMKLVEMSRRNTAPQAGVHYHRNDGKVFQDALLALCPSHLLISFFVSCKQLTEGRPRVSEAEQSLTVVVLLHTCISNRILLPERNNFFCSLQEEIRYMNKRFRALDAA